MNQGDNTNFYYDGSTHKECKMIESSDNKLIVDTLNTEELHTLVIDSIVIDKESGKKGKLLAVRGSTAAVRVGKETILCYCHNLTTELKEALYG